MKLELLFLTNLLLLYGKLNEKKKRIERYILIGISLRRARVYSFDYGKSRSFGKNLYQKRAL